MKNRAQEKPLVRIRPLLTVSLALAATVAGILAACANPLISEANKARQAAASPKMRVTIEGGTVLANSGTYDFGEAGINDAAEVFLLVTNTGPTALSIPAVTARIAGADPGSFSFGTAPPASLAPSESARFSIRFQAGSIGIKSATLSLVTNDTANLLYLVSLTGTGVDQVPAPVFVEGVFQSYPDLIDPPNIMITCSNPQAKIYYTTNSNDPSVATLGAGTFLYTNTGIGMTPIVQTIYIKAIAIAEGLQDSNIVTATISNIALSVPVITALPSNQFYPEDTMPPITVTVPGSSNAKVYYTVDGSTPTTINYSGYFKSGSSFTYNGIHSGGSFTLKAIAFINGVPPSAQAVPTTYTFKMSKPVFSTVQPQATPQDTYYAGEQSVTLTCAADGSIHYALDELALSNTAGTIYAPIIISEGAAGSSQVTTIRAIAYKTNWLDSDVLLGTFGICGPGVWSDGSSNSKWNQATWTP